LPAGWTCPGESLRAGTHFSSGVMAASMRRSIGSDCTLYFRVNEEIFPELCKIIPEIIPCCRQLHLRACRFVYFFTINYDKRRGKKFVLVTFL
jgi:hypothetical protein